MGNIILSIVVILWVVIMIYALTRDHKGTCNREDCETCPFPHCEGKNLQRHLRQPGSDDKDFSK